MSNPKEIFVEDARIIFRNFEGREGQYNRAGDRSFHVLLGDDMAEEMEKQGWNIKYLKAREEGDTPTPHVEVVVSYKGRPPHIVMITSRGRNKLGEDEVEVLDWVDIKTVDLMLNPYEWVVNGKSGTKAYLKSMYVTINEDPLELKYGHVMDDGNVDELPARAGAVEE